MRASTAPPKPDNLPTIMTAPKPILAVDSASPVVSLAIGLGDTLLGERTLELRQSSESMLVKLHELLAETALPMSQLGGLVALQGPGSFTGLRVGLATILGLHQATGLPATAIPTLAVLAAAVGDPGEELTVAVDALRGQWFSGTYRADPWPVPLSRESLVEGSLLLDRDGKLAGFGIGACRSEERAEARSRIVVEPPPLAATAAFLASRPEMTWDPSRLIQPIYFRPPAVTLPKKPA